MFKNVLTNNPCVILKKSISKEFQEILEEPRVQQLLLLLDRINEYSSFVFTNIITEFDEESGNEDLRLTIRCHIQQITIDMGVFNQKLNDLRQELSSDFIKTGIGEIDSVLESGIPSDKFNAIYPEGHSGPNKRRPLAYSNCAGFKR